MEDAPEHGYVIRSNGEVLCGNMEHAPTDPFTMLMVGNLMKLLNKKLEEKKGKEGESNDLGKEHVGEDEEPEEEANGASGSQTVPEPAQDKKKAKSKKGGKKKRRT